MTLQLNIAQLSSCIDISQWENVTNKKPASIKFIILNGSNLPVVTYLLHILIGWCQLIMATRCCSLLEMQVFTDTAGSSYGALMLSLIYAWTSCWTNNRDAGDLRRHRAHYDVTVMSDSSPNFALPGRHLDVLCYSIIYSYFLLVGLFLQDCGFITIQGTIYVIL